MYKKKKSGLSGKEAADDVPSWAQGERPLTNGRPTMASVFVLQHVHEREDGVEDVKFIGVYSSREKAQEAVVRIGRLPGFADAPDGFHIDEYRVDQDNRVEGYVVA
jgi:hypothetical protein